MPDTSIHWENCLEHAAVSDVGLRRSNNQDSWAVVRANSQDDWYRRGHVFIVADGMGAHAAGELASKMAVDTIPHTYYKLRDEAPADAIRKAVEDANAKIHSRGQANLDFRGMGTTASVLLLLPESALVAHVGDSRAYRLRGNRVEQLSFDHSLVWEMMASGKVREDQIPAYIPKNIITRSLGPSPQVQVDIEGPFPLAVGDTLLLCSDGLSGQVDDDEMGVVLSTLPPQEAAQMLVDLANLRGGPDNITVVVVRVLGTPEQGDVVDQAALRAGIAPRPVHPVYWIVLGVLVLVSLLLAFAAQYEAAAFAGLAVLIAAAIVLVQRFGGRSAPRGFQGPRAGRGPYTARTFVTNNEFVDKLARLAQQLREAATEEHWKVDWPRFNRYCERAMSAAEKRAYVEAVRDYCHAVSFMMQELREQRRKGLLPGSEGD